MAFARIEMLTTAGLWKGASSVGTTNDFSALTIKINHGQVPRGNAYDRATDEDDSNDDGSNNERDPGTSKATVHVLTLFECPEYRA